MMFAILGDAANAYNAIPWQDAVPFLAILIALNWVKVKIDTRAGIGKNGRLLGWLYIGDDELSLNEKMIEEGYAWSYDGGTKQKNFEELREIRRSFGTLNEG